MRKDVLYSILDRSGIPRQARSSGFHTFRHSVASFINSQTGNINGVTLFQRRIGRVRASSQFGILIAHELRFDFKFFPCRFRK
jgi:hypothetical protein